MWIDNLDFQIFYNNISSSSKTYQKKILHFFHEVEEIRQSPDAFQKICQVMSSVIQAYNWYYETTHCVTLLAALDVANVNDFYNILQHPYIFLYQIKPERIDEHQLLDNLIIVLSQNWNVSPDNKTVHHIAKVFLKGFLEHLTDKDIAFHEPSDLKKALREWLIHHINHSHTKEFDPYKINLDDLKITLHPLSSLRIVSSISFGVFDIGCIHNFLNDWGILPLAQIADSLGKYPGFSWVPLQALDPWVVGAFALSFFFQALESCRILLQTNTNKNQRQRAHWDLITSVTEVALNLTVIRKGKAEYIIFLTFIAKSLGIISILYKPNKVFFEKS